MASSAISLHGPIGGQDNRNVLINGDFNLWQRGVTVDWATNTIAGTAGGDYGYNKFVADRWRIYLDSKSSGVTAPSMTISRNLFDLGLPSGADNASKWYLNVFVGPTAPTGGAHEGHNNVGGFTQSGAGAGYSADGSFAALIQDIEDVRTLENKTCTVSFWAKSDISNQRVAPVLKQVFAASSGSTIEGWLISGSTGGLGHTLDNTWRKYQTSFNVPSIEGQPQVGASGDHALQLRLMLHANSGKAGTGVKFELGGPAQAGKTGNISFAQVQLEQGSKVTEFDKKSPAQEIMECNRFYQKTYNPDVAPGTDNSAIEDLKWAGMNSLNYPVINLDAISHYQFIPEMRTTPSITLYDHAGNANKTSHGDSTSNINVGVPFHIGHSGFNWGFEQSTRPSTIGIYYVHIVSDAELSVTTT